MARMQTIYVDMDDVLCETAQHFLVVLDREFGKRFSFDQLTNFDVGASCRLNPHEREQLYRIVHRADELLSIEPMAEAIDVLRRWREAGYEISIVTGRPPDTYEPSVEWLTRHRVPYQNFMIVDKYGRFTPETTIGITLSDLASHQFCWAVEDSPGMAKYLADQMGIPVALLDRPWNRTNISHALIGRYNHWHEIAGALPK